MTPLIIRLAAVPAGSRCAAAILLHLPLRARFRTIVEELRMHASHVSDDIVQRPSPDR